MPKNPTIVIKRPWIKEMAKLCVAVWFTASFFAAPIKKAMLALTPTPHPTAIAVIIFCSGKTSESAVIASSPIFAIK